ncbi:elongator complex protein 6 isoform X3 [Bos indicus]|uniref:Elongator complex protein 6 isoform X3 n=1 Tax=Bos indicus TaxID=9915 RepID=A0ABM4RCR9_BOSIN
MFPELNNLLNTTPEGAEQEKLTLLCDAKTDGSFLVHHFLSFYLKANCKVCFVALVQSFSHYNMVGQKLGVSLTTARERGQLVVLEGLKSAVDIFFRPQEEPHPLQFLRRAEPAAEGRHCPGVSASLKVVASVRGCVPVPEAVES